MRRLTTMILAGTWALAAAGPAHATLPVGNVVVNGGAEQGASSTDYFVTNAPTGWTVTPAGITQVRYDAVPAPARISGGAANTAFFIGGNGTTTRTMAQSVDLTAGAPEFEGGRVYATLSAELGGFDSQPDRATVSVALKAAGGATLRTLTLPTVTNGDRGGVTKLLARVDYMLVPAGTRSAEITVAFAFIASGGHTYNDAVADNLSLSFVDATEQPVLNPSAELGTASADSNPPRIPPPLWISTVGATQHQYAGTGFPTAADSAAIGGGNAFFAGGSANPLSTMSQEVNFSAARLAAIRTGAALAALSAHLGGYASEADRTEVSLTFWDSRTGDDVVLGTMSLPTVTAADRGNVTKFIRRANTQAIPVETDYAVLEVSFIRQAAVDSLAYNDGYLDNVVLDVVVAPQTQITGGPDGPTVDATPAWTFTADPPAGATFACRIDLGSFAACASGDTFGPLADGEHSFEVRASDAASTDPTPARREILVDTVAAVTAIGLTPSSGASTTSVGVAVSGSDPVPGSGVAEVRCALDPASVPSSFADLPVGACPTAVTAVGVHTLYAATRDVAGNRSAVSNARIVIESDPPTTVITTTPASGIDATSVTARVVAQDAGSGVAEVRCALDLATPPASFADLPATCPYVTATAITARGRHTLYAAARDRAGTVSAVVSKAITISSPPQTTISGGPAGTIGDPTPTFTFSADQDGSTFSCSVDGTAAGCASPFTTASLADGPHTFTVAATNADGLTDPTPATRAFTVDQGVPDVTPPVSTIALAPSSPPAGDVFAGSTGVVITADDGNGRGVEELRCVLDPPSAPASFADLPTGCEVVEVTELGEHTVYAAARDAAGNAELPIARRFTLAMRPTTAITGGPPVFTFASDVSGATFLCEVDAGGRVPCSSPFTAAGLSAGEHSFSVRAIAPNGLVDLLGARRDFTVAAPPGTVRPQVQLSGPSRALLGERVELYAGGGSITAKSEFGWDLDGDRRTDLTCTGLPGIRFTADEPGATNVSVAASGSLSGAAAQVLNTTGGRAAAARAASLQQGSLTQLALPNLVECLPPRPGTSEGFEEVSACFTTQFARPVTSVGYFFVRGCMRRGRTLADVPVAERPAVRTALEDWLRRNGNASTIYEGKPLVLGGTTKKAYTDADYERASQAMVWFVGEFVEFEGTQFEARSGHKIVLFPQLDRLVTSGADISVGDIALESPGAFSLNLAPKGGRVALGAFKVTSRRIVYGTNTTRRASRVRLAGLQFKGVMRATIRSGGTDLDGFVELPPTAFAADTAGIHLEVLRVGDVVNGFYGLQFAGTTVGPLDTEFLGIGARDVKLTIADLVTLRVSGTLCLGGPVGCVDLDATFKDGEFYEANAFVNLPDPGLAIAPSVFLNGFGGGFGVNPTRIKGKAKLTVLAIFDINGKLVLAFPSSATKFKLEPGDLDGLPAKLYRTYSATTIGASGEAGMKLPFGLGRVSLATAYFLYRAPAYVAFGGRLGFDKFGIRLTGGVDGEFNAENGRFNLFGDINARLFDIVDAGAVAGISSGGAGGCVDIGPVIIGGGVQWRSSGVELFLWPFDGCKWTRFTVDNVVGEPAQVGGAKRVVVRRGEPSRAIELRSTTGAPAVRVVGPGGVDLTTPDGAGVVQGRGARILRSLEVHITTVGLVDPAPGTYTITPLPGSPAITTVRSAEDPPDARVTAKVEGRGAVRTLRYDVLARPGQRVTFADVGEGATRIIGSVAGGRGTIRFRPAPGRGKRSVVARFELAGMNAERQNVARFVPPPVVLPRLSGLKLRRLATGRATLSWRPVDGAERYRVIATLGDGRQVRVTTRGRSARLSAPGLAYGAVVRVLPLATGREARAAVARLKTTRIARPSRFATLRK